MNEKIPLQVSNLGKVFGDLWAVRGVSFSLVPGEIYGFLGPNGAGKSTTMKMITGLLKPSEGSVRLFGLDPTINDIEVKRLIGMVPEHLQMYDRLTGQEFLEFAARMHGVSSKIYLPRIEELLDFLHLTSKADIQIKDYSNGMKKKTALAAALIHDPKILFLDEPFTGMDAMSVIRARQLISSLRQKNVTIFFSSHILELVEKLCDRLAIIVNGGLKNSGTVLQLVESFGVNTLEELFLGLAPGDGPHE